MNYLWNKTFKFNKERNQKIYQSGGSCLVTFIQKLATGRNWKVFLFAIWSAAIFWWQENAIVYPYKDILNLKYMIVWLLISFWKCLFYSNLSQYEVVFIQSYRQDHNFFHIWLQGPMGVPTSLIILISFKHIR